MREYCCRLRKMKDASEEDLRKEKEKMIKEVHVIKI